MEERPLTQLIHAQRIVVGRNLFVLAESFDATTNNRLEWKCHEEFHCFPNMTPDMNKISVMLISTQST
jgi:hypothetical protein